MLLEKIRIATAEDHKRLEKQLFPFLENMQTKAGYARLLNAFYGYIFPVQEKIIQFIDKNIVQDIEERRNASFLTDDLRAIGFPLHTDHSTCLPVINDHASALGALYVLEGSTLGGKIIAKMIAEKLGSTEGLCFFRGYGAETGPMWKKFTQYLEYPLTEKEAATVVNSANETFRCFGTWFENTLHLS